MPISEDVKKARRHYRRKYAAEIKRGDISVKVFDTGLGVGVDIALHRPVSYEAIRRELDAKKG